PNAGNEQQRGRNPGRDECCERTDHTDHNQQEADALVGPIEAAVAESPDRVVDDRVQDVDDRRDDRANKPENHDSYASNHPHATPLPGPTEDAQGHAWRRLPRAISYAARS